MKKRYSAEPADDGSAAMTGRPMMVFLCLLGCLLGPAAGIEAWLKGEISTPAQVYLVLLMPVVLIALAIVFRVFENAQRMTICFLTVSYCLILLNAVAHGGVTGATAVFLAMWTALAGYLFGIAGATVAIALAAAPLAFAWISGMTLPGALAGLHGPIAARWLSVSQTAIMLLMLSGAAILRVQLTRAARRLEAATRQVVDADSVKSRFLANINKEVTTPASGLAAMSELISNSKLDANQKLLAETMRKSGDTLATTIGNILDMAQIEAGQFDLEAEPFDVAETFEDVAMALAPKAALKDLELIVRIAPTLPKSLSGDAGRLQQATRCLLENAVKFTETGQIFLDVDGVTHDGTAARVAAMKVTVTDTGIGVPAAKQHLLFKKFSQINAPSTGERDGAGLGLAIASALMSNMGGRIGVESTPGHGSTFWFSVSLPTADHEPANDAGRRAVKAGRVLIASSNETSRKVLSEQLHAWGHETAAVQSEYETLIFLRVARERGLQINCVILDLHEAEPDALALARMLMKEPAAADIPILLLTTANRLSRSRELIKGHFQECLIKPVRARILRQSVSRIIADRKSSGANGKAQQRADNSERRLTA